MSVIELYGMIISVLTKRYSDALKAPDFLQSLFEVEMVGTRYIDIEVQRHLQVIADDILPGGEGNYSTQNTKSIKKFYIPGYEEKSSIMPIMGMLNLNLKEGLDTILSPQQIDDFMHKIINGEGSYEGADARFQKIKRSIERLCASLIIDRKLTFVNNLEIDFAPKDASTIAASTNGGVWSTAASKPETAIQKAIDFLVTVGKSNAGNRFMMIGRSSDITNLLATTQISDKRKEYQAKWADVGINYTERVRDNLGGQYLCTLQVGASIVDLFSYEAFYEKEDETQVNYIPAGSIAVLPVNQKQGITSDMRLVYGATEVLNKAGNAYSYQKGAFNVSTYADLQAKANIQNITSAAIPLTASIDRFAVIKTEV